MVPYICLTLVRARVGVITWRSSIALLGGKQEEYRELLCIICTYYTYTLCSWTTTFVNSLEWCLHHRQKSERLGFFVPFALCATALLGRALALEIVSESPAKWWDSSTVNPWQISNPMQSCILSKDGQSVAPWHHLFWMTCPKTAGLHPFRRDLRCSLISHFGVATSDDDHFTDELQLGSFFIGKAERLTVTESHYPSSVTLHITASDRLEGLCQPTMNIQLLQLKFWGSLQLLQLLHLWQ